MKRNICTICCRGVLPFSPLPVLDDVLPSLPSSLGSQGQARLLRNALLPTGASSFGVSSASFSPLGMGFSAHLGFPLPPYSAGTGAPAERGAVEERGEPQLGGLASIHKPHTIE